MYSIRVGIFFIACTTLLLELTLIRIFDHLWFTNMAYMIITLAMFSIGVAGVLVSLKPAEGQKYFEVSLPILAVVMAVVIFLVLPILNNLQFSYTDLSQDSRVGDTLKIFVTFFLILAAISLPFLVSGLILAAIFSRHAKQIQSLYFWDLVGAAIGCAVVLLAVKHYGAPGLLVLCSGGALLAAAFFSRRRAISITLMLLAISVAVSPMLSEEPYEIRPHMNKRSFAHYYEHDQIEHSVWDPVSSINIVDFRSGIKWVAYDGGSQTSYYYRFDGDFDALQKILNDPEKIISPEDPYSDYVDKYLDLLTAYNSSGNGLSKTDWGRRHYESFGQKEGRTVPGPIVSGGRAAMWEHFWGPYVLASHFLKQGTDQNVLIIGAAGGQETKAALLYGAAEVDAVELVGSVIDLAKTQYADWTGHIYNHPKVNAIWDEGRSFLRASNKKYDIIQLMSNHTSSSLAAGNGAMSPVYLQTVEAYIEYFSHLKDDGVLHINHHLYPRMVATASKAWQKLGRSNFQEHVFVMEHKELPDNLPTMLIKMSPWTKAELNQMEGLLNHDNAFHVVANPVENTSYLSQEFFDGQLSEATIDRVPYWVRAPTDDKPFFNFIRKSLAVEEINHDNFANSSATELLNKSRETGLPLDVLHLFVTAAASLFFALIVLGIPLLSSQTGRSPWPGKASFMGYFACLGAGFIIIELVLIQMFMKLIGFPPYTYATAVFSLLLGAGLGSAASAYLNSERLLQLRLPFFAALVTVLVLIGVRDVVFDAALQSSIGIRMLIAGVMLVPVGFFLGMPFPVGITLAKGKPPGTVAWCWAMNGLFTVIGGFLSGILSIYFGFTLAIMVALIFYLIAIGLLGTMFHARGVQLAT